MLNYIQIYKFDRIQTSQTGGQPYIQLYFPLQSNWVFSGSNTTTLYSLTTTNRFSTKFSFFSVQPIRLPLTLFYRMKTHPSSPYCLSFFLFLFQRVTQPHTLIVSHSLYILNTNPSLSHTHPRRHHICTKTRMSFSYLHGLTHILTLC